MTRTRKTPSHAVTARIARWLPALLVFVVSGCPEPGSLENREQFTTSLPPCVVATFRGHCALSGCHVGTIPAADLDLAKSGLVKRLYDQPSTHLDITLDGDIPEGCPEGDLLINTRNPAESWMLKKIRNEQGDCGDSMPAIPTGFGAEHQSCLETWILSIQSDAGAGGTGGTPGDASSEGGAAGDDEDAAAEASVAGGGT